MSRGPEKRSKSTLTLLSNCKVYMHEHVCVSPIGRGTPERPRVVLVFFLGGVTYAEISALRFLSQREEGKCIHNTCDDAIVLKCMVVDCLVRVFFVIYSICLSVCSDLVGTLSVV